MTTTQPFESARFYAADYGFQAKRSIEFAKTRGMWADIQMAYEFARKAAHWAAVVIAEEELRYAEGLAEPFCACGRRYSQCDGSRAGCHKKRMR